MSDLNRRIGHPQDNPVHQEAMASMRSGEAKKKKTYRFTINFSESAWATLVLLAEKKGKSMSEVLRDAIALEKWFQNTIDAGGRIMVEKDGTYQEVIPR